MIRRVERVSDDEWAARARDRVARGGTPWSEPREAAPPAQEPVGDPGPRCPACSERPRLRVFARYEVGTGTPLWFCPACYGFWAPADSLSAGAADSFDEHPALFAPMVAPRCHSCGRPLEANSCLACRRELPPRDCPSCGLPMVRAREGPVTLDRCKPCDGAWFDIGELAEAYGLERPRGLASAAALAAGAGVLGSPDELSGDTPDWQVMAAMVLRALAPFL